MGPAAPLPSRATLAQRPRRRLTVALRRQPIVFWAFAALTAGAAYWSVSSALARVADGAETYGNLVPIVVAARPLEPGSVIGDADVALRRLPEALVPEQALAEPPVGAAVRTPIYTGEAVIADRLAPDGSVGLAATLDPAQRAVAIPTPPHRAPLERGQRVDVLATVDPGLAGGRNPTTVVAEAALVLSVEEGGITVAVSRGAADRIATALATAIVTVVIAPG